MIDISMNEHENDCRIFLNATMLHSNKIACNSIAYSVKLHATLKPYKQQSNLLNTHFLIGHQTCKLSFKLLH